MRRHATFVQVAIGEDELSEPNLMRFVEDPGGAMARAGLVERDEAPRINRVVLAIYSSRRVASYLETAAQVLNKDPEVRTILEEFGGLRTLCRNGG